MRIFFDGVAPLFFGALTRVFRENLKQPLPYTRVVKYFEVVEILDEQ